MYVISPQVPARPGAQNNRQAAKPTIINMAGMPAPKGAGNIVPAPKGAGNIVPAPKGAGNIVPAQNPATKQIPYVPEPRVEYEETEDSSSSEEEKEEEEEFDYCCGEGYVLLEDEEGSEFRFRLVSEPNPGKLTHSLDRILKRIRKWFRRSQPITNKNVSDLRIFCPNSALTLLGPQQGLFIGMAGIPILAVALNALKIAPHLSIQISSRLIAGDVLLLNINLGVTANAKPPGTNNPLLGIVTLSGNYHIVDSGAGLLIDSLTVFNNSPRTI